MKVAVLYVDQFEASTPPPTPKAFKLLQIGLFKFLPPKFGPTLCSNALPKCPTQMPDLMVNMLILHRRLDTSDLNSPSHPDKIQIPHPRARMTVKYPLVA